MWRRDNNFQASMLHELSNFENNISLIKFFFTQPLIYGRILKISDNLQTSFRRNKRKRNCSNLIKYEVMICMKHSHDPTTVFGGIKLGWTVTQLESKTGRQPKVGQPDR